MVTCLEDNTEHEDIEALHKYLRKLKITQANYYHKHYPRHDLATGEIIKYDNYIQYFSSFFTTKTNIRKFIKEKPEEAKKWSIDFLKDRKEEKELVYAPCQVELRSLVCPPIQYYNKIGGYNNICKQLGYKLRFEKKFVAKPLDKNLEFIIDTREQRPLRLQEYKTTVSKVDCGDYALAGEKDKKIYIERKDLKDFVGTITRDLGRFEKEIVRAKETDSYLIVLVENNINDALGFNYLPQMKYTKVSPSHVFKNVRDIMHKYDNIQFLFVSGRIEAAKAVVTLLNAGEQVKDIDLELAYETGELTFN